MSGGHFEYKQYDIGRIADEVDQLIHNNENAELNEWGDLKGSFYSESTIAEFKRGLFFLRQAQIYAQRIDWLVSGDDGEDSFHKRLNGELKEIWDVDWAGLTDYDVSDLCPAISNSGHINLIRAVESRLKMKNTK